MHGIQLCPAAFDTAIGEISDMKNVLKGNMNPVISNLSKIPAVPRIIKFSGDLGILGVQAAFGLQYALADPVKTIKAYAFNKRVTLQNYTLIRGVARLDRASV